MTQSKHTPGPWLPIETRPEDGEFLAWDPVSGKQDVCQSIRKMRIVEGKACYDVLSCAAVQQDNECGAYDEEFQGHRATHWAPLLPPPKADLDDSVGEGASLGIRRVEVTDEMASALIAKYREIWPGAGWPPLDIAKQLLTAALTKSEGWA